MTGSVNYEEVRKTATLAMKELDPSLPFGTELFEAIAKVTVSICIEAVICRDTPSGKEVFLTQRRAGEAYEGQWHCPGTFIRSGEQIEDVVRRLSLSENLGVLSNVTFINFHNNLEEVRGHVVQLIFKMEGSPSFEVGSWFPISGLPENIVENHRDVVIPMIIK